MKLKLLILAFLVMLTPSLLAQPSIQYSHGEPTDLEQYMLELINRARANPTQEGIFLDTLDSDYAQRARENKPEFFTNLRQEFASYPVAQPVAFNSQLIEAARLHSQDMITRNYFDHSTLEGLSPKDRVEAQGYSGYPGENIFGGGASNADEIIMYHFGFMVDHDNRSHDTRPFGHRLNTLRISHNEVGIGNVVIGNSSRITQDFGRAYDRIFLLGVVYQDQNDNDFYDPGEGLGGVTVMPSEGEYYAVTSVSGGYAIPFEISETRDAGEASTVIPPDSNYREDVVPIAEEFEQNYRSNSANQVLMTLSLTASGGELNVPITQTLSMVEPVLITYKINQSDGVYWDQEFTLGNNVKVDFNTRDSGSENEAVTDDNTTEQPTPPTTNDNADEIELAKYSVISEVYSLEKDGPLGNSTAQFYGGISLNDSEFKLTNESVVRLNDTITVGGIIVPEQTHVGQQADILVVGLYTPDSNNSNCDPQEGSYYMNTGSENNYCSWIVEGVNAGEYCNPNATVRRQTVDSYWQSWNGNLTELVPLYTVTLSDQVKLTAEEGQMLYRDKPDYTGYVCLNFGYRLHDPSCQADETNCCQQPDKNCPLIFNGDTINFSVQE